MTMYFKDVKSGFMVHLFDRANLTYEEAKVTNAVSHADVKPGNYGKILVDLTIETSDGKKNTYEVADSEQVAYAGTLMIAVGKDCVLAELRNIKGQAEDAIKRVEQQKQTVARCSELLEQLDTAFKEKQENEQRFKTLEDKLDKVLKMFDSKF